MTIEAQRAAIVAEIERQSQSAKLLRADRRWAEALSCAMHAVALKKKLDALESTSGDGVIIPIAPPCHADANDLHGVDTNEVPSFDEFEDLPDPDHAEEKTEGQINDYAPDVVFDADDVEDSLQPASAAAPQSHATDVQGVDSKDTPLADEWEDFPDAEYYSNDVEGLHEDYDPSVVFEADDFDEALQPPNAARVQTNTVVARAHRAYQEAAKLAVAYGWNEDGVRIMAAVFTRYFWSRAKTAMIVQLEAGMTPGQLRVALLARDLWAQSSEYHVSCSSSDVYLYVYPAMSWSMAVALGDELGDDASEDDVLGFLDELRDEWRISDDLMREFPAFYNYVRSCFDLYEEAPPRRRE